jgi:site-specific recombinase XerD
MHCRKYDKKNASKPYGVKWGDWKTPSFKFFHFEGERDEFFAELQHKEREEGLAVLRINTLEAQIMRRCVDLVGSPEKVLAACEQIAEVNHITQIRIEKAVKEFLDEKLNIGRDENYLRANRNILNRFISVYPSSFLTAIDAKQSRDFLFSLNFKPVTVKNHKRVMNTFFNWCIRQGYAAKNPFKNTAIPDVIMPEPEFLSLCELKKVMGTAVQHHPDAIAYLALQAFAGLRSSACSRLDIKNIRFDQKGILIRSDMAKNKRRIYIDGHPDNLWKWLLFAKEIAPEGFELSKRSYDLRKMQIAKKTGFKMPHNALRHSFCTYHGAMEGNAYRTCTLLTHRGNPDVFYENYKGNATRSEGSAWFDLIPPTV